MQTTQALHDAGAPASSRQNGLRQNAILFGGLMVAASLASVAILPYAAAITRQDLSDQPLWLLLAMTVVQNLIVIGPLTALGLWLGPKIGLGAPDLHDLVFGGPDAARQVRSSMILAAVVGALAGAVTLVLAITFAPSLPTELADMPWPTWWEGLLAAISAGVNEELMLRLGLMTLVAWIGTRISGSRRVTPTVAWIANILTALSFGALHLPLAAAIAPLTIEMVIRTMVMNSSLGVIFGWLYWRRGLLAAMVAHFSVDVMLHVIGALITPASMAT
jgi:hypothetical protein